MMSRPVLPGAVAHRAMEIGAHLHMWRWYTGPASERVFKARLGENGERIKAVALQAARDEVAALAARGVLVLGPDEGPLPIEPRKPFTQSPPRQMSVRKPVLIAFGDEEPKAWGDT